MVFGKEPPGIKCHVGRGGRGRHVRARPSAIGFNHLFKVATVMMLVVCPLLMLESRAGFLTWLCRKSMVEEYNLLNRFLVQRVPESDSPTENIIAAQELVKEYRNGKHSEASIEYPSEQAMIQFSSLINLMDPDEPHCDLYAMNILLDNAKAEASDIFRPFIDRKPLRRIGMVIWQVAYDHAKQCFEEYPHKFARSIKNVRDKQTLLDIVNLMGAMIETSKTKVVYIDNRREMHKHQRNALKSKGVLVTSSEVGKALLAYLRLKTRHEPISAGYLSLSSNPTVRDQLVLHEHKVVAIIDQYIYDRCDVMFSAFGSVLGPAELEVQMFRDQHKYRAANKDMATFLIWLEYYRLCKEIIANKVKVEDRVIEAIWAERYVKG